MAAVIEVETQGMVAGDRQPPVAQRDAEGVARLDDGRLGEVDEIAHPAAAPARPRGRDGAPIRRWMSDAYPRRLRTLVKRSRTRSRARAPMRVASSGFSKSNVIARPKTAR